MNAHDIDEAIRQHTQWRRQFLNAFAGGNYAEMPLSGHRGCLLALRVATLPAEIQQSPQCRQLLAEDSRFHGLASEILELSENGMADAADLLLPQLSDQSHHLVSALDAMRSVVGPA